MSVIPTLPIVNVSVGPGIGSKTIQLPAASTIGPDFFIIRDALGNCSPLSSGFIYLSTTGLDTLDSFTNFIMSTPSQTVKVLRNPPNTWSFQQDYRDGTQIFNYSNFEGDSNRYTPIISLSNRASFSSPVIQFGEITSPSYSGLIKSSNFYPTKSFQTSFQFTLSNFDPPTPGNSGLSNFGICFTINGYSANNDYIGYGSCGWSNPGLATDPSLALRLCVFGSSNLVSLPLVDSIANNAYFQTRGNGLVEFDSGSNVVALGEDNGLGTYRYNYATSTLTSNWNSNSIPYMSSLYDMVYDSSRSNYVAVGEGQASKYNIQFSPAIIGPSWAPSADIAFDIRGNGVIVNNVGTQYIVAVGEGTGTFESNTMILGSNNGLNWSKITQASGAFTDAGYGITFDPVVSGGLWLTVGKDSNASTIKYTTDATGIWSNATGLFDIAGYGITRSVPGAFPTTPFVAVGEDTISTNTIKYSGDGSNYSNAVQGGFNIAGYGVTGGQVIPQPPFPPGPPPSPYTVWVAVGAHTSSVSGLGTIQYSTDASNWYPANSGFSTAGYGVTFQNVFIAVGDDLSGSSIKYSSDGINWTDSASGYFSTKGYGVIGAPGGTFYAVGEGSNISTSVLKSTDNGSNWSPFISSGGFSVAARGICAGLTNEYIVVGEAEPTLQSFDTISPAPPLLEYAALKGPQITGPVYGALFDSGSNYVICVGTDPTPSNTVQIYSGNWNSSTDAPFTSARDIIKLVSPPFGYYPFYAVGYAAAPSNTICGSSNGSSWFAAANTGGFSGGGLGIYYVGLTISMIAVGEDNNPLATIQYTGDGSNWSNINSGGFSIRGRSVTYDSGLSNYIAVGDDADPLKTVQTSSDGSNWVPLFQGGYTVGGNSVLYNSLLSPLVKNTFVVGENSSKAIPYSPIERVKLAAASGVDVCGKGVISSIIPLSGPLPNIDFQSGNPIQVDLQGAEGILSYTVKDTLTGASFFSNVSTFPNAPFQFPTTLPIDNFSSILSNFPFDGTTSFYGFTGNSDLNQNTVSKILSWSLSANGY